MALGPDSAHIPSVFLTMPHTTDILVSLFIMAVNLIIYESSKRDVIAPVPSVVLSLLTSHPCCFKVEFPALPLSLNQAHNLSVARLHRGSKEVQEELCRLTAKGHVPGLSGARKQYSLLHKPLLHGLHSFTLFSTSDFRKLMSNKCFFGQS